MGYDLVHGHPEGIACLDVHPAFEFPWLPAHPAGTANVCPSKGVGLCVSIEHNLQRTLDCNPGFKSPPMRKASSPVGAGGGVSTGGSVGEKERLGKSFCRSDSADAGFVEHPSQQACGNQ